MIINTEHQLVSMKELFIEKMTSPEVDKAINYGYRTVVIACGAIEQHGPHLPLFLDTEHGTRLADGIARQLGKTLVAPTIRVGCSDEHMDFAGTISFQPDTFRAVCMDYCTSLARHGFEHILFVPSHGGNFVPLFRMLDELRDAVGPDVRIDAFTDMHAVVELWRKVAEEEAGLGANVGGHADIAESSIMLALYPDLVKQHAAAAGFTGVLKPDIINKIMNEGISSVASNGVLGDARGMSESIGRRCIEEYVKMAVTYFQKEET